MPCDLSVNSFPASIVFCEKSCMCVTKVPCGFKSYGGWSYMASPVLTLISWLRVSRSTNDVNMNPASRCMQLGILSSPGWQELFLSSPSSVSNLILTCWRRTFLVPFLNLWGDSSHLQFGYPCETMASSPIHGYESDFLFAPSPDVPFQLVNLAVHVCFS